MAEKAVSVVRRGKWLQCEWLAVTENDTFAAVYVNDNVTDIVMEVEGTFGSETIVLSQWVVTEAADFAALDPGGGAVAFTADNALPIRDVFPFLRPTGTGGSGTLLDVRIHMKTRL